MVVYLGILKRFLAIKIYFSFYKNIPELNMTPWYVISPCKVISDYIMLVYWQVTVNVSCSLISSSL